MLIAQDRIFPILIVLCEKPGFDHPNQCTREVGRTRVSPGMFTEIPSSWKQTFAVRDPAGIGRMGLLEGFWNEDTSVRNQILAITR